MENVEETRENSIEAFSSIMDMVVGEDDRYKIVKGKTQKPRKKKNSKLF